jgi:hypothetical protein
MMMGWKLNDLTDRTGAPLAIFNPSGYMFAGQDTQHVVYQGFVAGQGDDGRVHKLWWKQDDGWHHSDLTADGHAPPVINSPVGYEFGGQHVVYEGGDNHINHGHVHELWFEVNGWHHNDLTVAARAPLASDQPTGFAFDACGTQFVHYRGTDGHVHQLWRDGSAWHHNDLTAATGAPLAISNPTAYVFPAQNTQHVVFNADSHHIIELFWVPS